MLNKDDQRLDLVESRRALFAEALIASGPSSELGDAAKDFDWLPGGWRAIVRDYDEDGSFNENVGEWWFSWVLEGRAIQDVWIVPRRSLRSGAGLESNRYGTTIRYFDSSSGLWRIVWINPVTCKQNELCGRRDGNCISLEGRDGDDVIRWSFNDIESSNFHWKGERRNSTGEWTVGAEFFLERM